MSKETKTEDRFMRMPEVAKTVGRSRTSIYYDVKEGRFPKPHKIGRRAIAWKESEIQDWIARGGLSNSSDEVSLFVNDCLNTTNNIKADSPGIWRSTKFRVANERVGRSILKGFIDGSQGSLTSSQRRDYQKFARALRINVGGTCMSPLISSDETGADVMSVRWVRYPENARKVLKVLDAVVLVKSEQQELWFRRMNELAGKL